MSKRTAAEMEFVKERYKFVDGILGEVEKLIKDKDRKETIQAKYKEAKKWLEAEYKEYSKRRYDGGYIQTIYMPLIVDVFVQSFKFAKTNSSIAEIGAALYNARDYYNHWSAQLKATPLK